MSVPQLARRSRASRYTHSQVIAEKKVTKDAQEPDGTGSYPWQRTYMLTVRGDLHDRWHFAGKPRADLVPDPRQFHRQP